MSDASRTPLHAAVDGQVAAVSSSECVFRPANGGAPVLLPIAAVEAMDACRAFRPLARHVEEVAAMQPQLPREAVARGLESLVARGLFVSDREFLAAPAGAADDAPLRAVFVRACNRPKQLERLLASLAANERRHRGGHRYVVLDDSRDAEAARAHAALLGAFARETGARTVLVDAPRWNAIVAGLAAVAPEAVRTAIARDDAAGAPRFGGGKGYNLAALLGAGARYALLDDDFVLPLRRAPDAAPGLALAAGAGVAARFHDDPETALGIGDELDADPFEHARTHCGVALGTLWSRPGLAPDLEGFAPSLAPRVRAASRVATLTHGHRGDSGAQSSRWMYLLDPDSRRAFARDEGRYARHLEAGAVWFGPARARVDEYSAFTPFAVDARDFVPPTMAGGRSEDILFGVLLAACDTACVALHTNLSIGHRQEARRVRSGSLGEPATPVTNQWLADLLRSAAADLHADAPRARCAALAGVLRDAASASDARLAEMVASYLRFARADMAASLARVRDEAGDAPDFWKRDVERMIAVHREALVREPEPRFSDWTAAGADGVGALRGTLASFAAVLEAWPALYDHAARCAESLLQEPA